VEAAPDGDGSFEVKLDDVAARALAVRIVAARGTGCLTEVTVEAAGGAHGNRAEVSPLVDAAAYHALPAAVAAMVRDLPKCPLAALRQHVRLPYRSTEWSWADRDHERRKVRVCRDYACIQRDCLPPGPGTLYTGAAGGASIHSSGIMGTVDWRQAWQGGRWWLVESTSEERGD
jgi:hypothetical protein